MKQSIIEYSKQYSIVTQFTSFVAIEERDDEEKKKLQYGPDSTGKILVNTMSMSYISGIYFCCDMLCSSMLSTSVCLKTTDQIIFLLTFIVDTVAVNDH